MSKSPQALIKRLVGRAAPNLSLPFTTYANHHDLEVRSAEISLADIASRHILVVYFFPSEDEDEGPVANTMSRVYRTYNDEIRGLGGRIVGVSTQTALAQQQIALAELFPQLLLSDSKLVLAEALGLPTKEIAGKDEYLPFAVLIRDGVIAHAIYPIDSPRAHMAEILAWLDQTKAVS